MIFFSLRKCPILRHFSIWTLVDRGSKMVTDCPLGTQAQQRCDLRLAMGTLHVLAVHDCSTMPIV